MIKDKSFLVGGAKPNKNPLISMKFGDIVEFECANVKNIRQSISNGTVLFLSGVFGP